MNVHKAVAARRSIRAYVPGEPIDDAALRAIFAQVVLTPSSFNLQHWRFVVVRAPELKAKMMAAAWNQAQVRDCAAAILVCGDLDAYRDAPRIYAGAAPDARTRKLGLIERMYADNPGKQRDEALRSASMAAMTLMLAAREQGWDTGPMIGFDAEPMAELLGLGPADVPVMLVTLGRRAAEPGPRPFRKPVEEVVRLERMDGPWLV